jgi:flagellar biosynthesis protein FlhG
MALHLAALGRRTCLFDADLGLANVTILLGLNPERTLADVIVNNHSLKDIIIRDYEGIDIIPGSSGVDKMADLQKDQLKELIHSFSELDGYDFLLLDTSAGISRNVISFCLACSEVVVIITPEPTSITDAYALLKVISLNGFKGTVKVVVNQFNNEEVAKRVYLRFKETVEKYLPIGIIALGTVIKDHRVAEAVEKQKPLLSLYPDSPASNGIKDITRHLLQKQPDDLKTSSMISFWANCLRIIKGPLNLTGSRSSGTEVERPQAMEQNEMHQLRWGQETHSLMEELIQGVSSLSQELRLLREAINTGKEPSFHASDPRLKEDAELRSRSIQLDFDAFLERRVGKRRNE